MSLIRAVSAGTLVGAVAALSIYAAVGPDDLGRVAAPVPPTFAPVPTPTVTQLAECTPPAVLTKGVCLTTKPGPRIVVTVAAPRVPAPAPRSTTPRAVVPDAEDDGDEDEREDEDREDHEDEDHDDEDREDEDREDEDDEDHEDD